MKRKAVRGSCRRRSDSISDRLFWSSSALAFAFGLGPMNDDMRRRFIKHAVDLLLNGCDE